MDTNSPHDDGTAPKGDLMVGREPIKAFCVDELGLPETTDPYYLKKIGFPIGNLGGDKGKLIASKRKLTRHVQKLAAA